MVLSQWNSLRKSSDNWRVECELQCEIHVSSADFSAKSHFQMSPFKMSEKTMTARDVTGFCAFFSAQESGQCSPHFGAISLLNYTGNQEKKKHWRKFKKIQWRRHPEIADFCPLSWSNVSWPFKMSPFRASWYFFAPPPYESSNERMRITYPTSFCFMPPGLFRVHRRLTSWSEHIKWCKLYW